jgi:hypothetical protein
VLLVLPVKKEDKDERFSQEKNKLLERAIRYAARNCMTPSEFVLAQEKQYRNNFENSEETILPSHPLIPRKKHLAEPVTG